MSSPQIVRAMREAVAHHQAGRFAQAERGYRDVLAKEPRNADALHLLGLLAHQAGNHESARELISRAITLRPQAEFYVNLSQAYRGLNRLQDCADACARAVQLGPNLPEAHNNLGSVLKDLGRYAEAGNALSRAIQLRPDYFQAYTNLANVLTATGQLAVAENALRRAIAINPRYGEAYSNLTNVLNLLQRFDEAVDAGRHAIALKPDLSAAYVNLGTALHNQGYFEEGNAVYRRGLSVDPDNPHIHFNMLAALNYIGSPMQMRQDDSVGPARATPAEIFAAHVNWGRRYDAITAAAAPHSIPRDCDRRLRIGYVSADFKRHSVAFFIEPLLANHDHSRFEITAYSAVTSPDAVTARLRGLCDRWRDIAGMTDQTLAAAIRADAIDILIDLAGHTAGSRLPMFALRPAPVQMTYLGYPGTSGLRAMDYRITDAIADPPGAEQFHTEKLLRVEPGPFLCYQPPPESPPVVDAPAIRNGFITFGSFNKASKAGPETIALWARVLRAVPNSRLVMKAFGLGGAGSRRRIGELFAGEGIAADRIELVESIASTEAHLARYGAVDIALDTYPYHGTTTTCEALWMGVAVVSRIGATHVSRVGATLLNAVGLGELAAADDAAFVDAAVGLATDLEPLSALRRGMRERMISSLLMNAPLFASKVESLFCKAWVGVETESQ
jgi:predicted O-linked N-acetylglucosamine transferase (SPINDLY family)